MDKSADPDALPGSGAASGGRPRPRRGTLTRRAFVLLVVAGAGAAAYLWIPRRRTKRFLLKTLGWSLDPRSGTGALDAGATLTLIAFGEVLVPSAVAGGGTRGTAPAGSEDESPVRKILRSTLEDLAATEPGYRAELAAAAGFLERKSAAILGTRLTEASLEQRRGLVERIFRPYVSQPGWRRALQYLTPDGRAVGNTWRFAARPIMVGFYNTPLGWRLFGYPYQPGQCNDLISYTRPPEPPA